MQTFERFSEVLGDDPAPHTIIALLCHSILVENSCNPVGNPLESFSADPPDEYHFEYTYGFQPALLKCTPHGHLVLISHERIYFSCNESFEAQEAKQLPRNTAVLETTVASVSKLLGFDQDMFAINPMPSNWEPTLF